MPFNRTIVELKLGLGYGATIVASAFNRTIVELKRIYNTICFMRYNPFNRTIVELKHVRFGNVALHDPLLIEPLWN